MRSKTSKYFHILVFALLIAINLSGCRSDPATVTSTSPVSANDTLRVGVSTNAPPIIFRQDNKITGLEAALALKLGKFINKKVVFVEVPWAQQLEYLNQGKTDIVMSGMTITPQRQYLADFIAPYLRSGQIMLVRSEDHRKFTRGIVDVMNSNYRIGTVTNTTGDLFVSETITNVNEVNFTTSQKAVDALIAKDIDVLVYDAPMVCHYAAVNHTDKLIPVLAMATEEYLAWAVRKGDKELNSSARLFLKKITESGELKKEINRWIPYLNG